MRRLILPQPLLSAMVAAAEAGFPEETCGLIGGREGRAERLFPIENIRHSPVAFEMDPLAQIEAMLAIEADGMEIVAIYHSHPSGPPNPSPTDIAQAYYPDAVYIIISLAKVTAPEVNAFTIRDGAVSTVDLHIARHEVN